MSGFRKAFQFAAALLFLCILIGGVGRLIGHDDMALPEPAAETAASMAVHAEACLVDSGNSAMPVPGIAKARTETRELTSVPVPVSNSACRLRTDSNGNILRGRLSYMRLLYQVFPLSDGFA